MRTAAVRAVSILLAVMFVLSSLVTGTLGWQSLNQQAKNETQGDAIRQVELHKLEKLPDGTETEIPVPGATFYLFTENGTQLDGRYVIDGEGRIRLSLEPGSYYFEESASAPGFTFDKDADGNCVTRYPFTVTGVEAEAVVVTAYNVRLQGALTIEKEVKNADGSDLTEAQKLQTFVFTVTFSDSGAYEYRIDGGEPQQITSGGTLALAHGQQAVFNDLPAGVTYAVTEQPTPDYTVSGTGHTGTITETGSAAYFVNTYSPDPVGSLTVSKEVIGEGADLQKEFIFTAVINGETETFALKHGERQTYSYLPMGTTYIITETDYTAEGYTATVREYTGTITGEEELLLPFVNAYQPQVKPGSLTVSKEVLGDNPDPDKDFTFIVTFSDGGTYEYTVDGGEPQQITSGGPLTLKGGQEAVLANLPDGVTYTVRETDAGNYLPVVEEISGTIVGGENAFALFQNRVPDEPEDPATLIVTKELAGEYPEAAKNKEFHFTLTVNGVEQEFTLKPGESKEFEIPAGASYDVREDSYFAEGYALTLENGTGTALSGQTVTVTATNTYVGEVQTEIAGEKTWELGEYDVTLPESITVQLKNGDVVVEEITVNPDDSGEWHYTFTAPKYDADVEEIHYTVEELPVAGFTPSYDGFNILNTYIPPVEIDSPIIEKLAEGKSAPETEFAFLLRGEKNAPMPEDSDGDTKTVTRTGSGEAELGTFSFAAPGVYTYTISELNTGADGWTYDNTVYTLTVTVTLENGTLHASYTLAKDGEPADKALFTNHYTPQEPDIVKISGTKTWNHGDNPNRPDSVIIYVYANGELAAQRLVTAKDGWQYAFVLRRHAQDGREIVYTVGEADVPGYTAEINGYDIVNTYTGTIPEPPGPGDDEPSEPDNPHTPQTGDNTVLWPWVMAMILSFAGLVVTLLLKKEKHKNNTKRKH